MSIPADHRYAVATDWLMGLPDFHAPMGQTNASLSEALVRLHRLRRVSPVWWLFYWDGARWERMSVERAREQLECPT